MGLARLNHPIRPMGNKFETAAKGSAGDLHSALQLFAIQASPLRLIPFERGDRHHVTP